jgi:hypothetical protein
MPGLRYATGAYAVPFVALTILSLAILAFSSRVRPRSDARL